MLSKGKGESSLKKLLALAWILLLIHPVLPHGAASAQTPVKELTILAYICGSDLESDDGQASGDIREMLSSGIGDSDQVNVMIATGGSTQWQKYGISSRNVQYYRLGKSSPELLKDNGRQNMGDAGTLAGFLQFATAAAPARRYMLILWDHGGGPVYGLCNDANFKDDSLTLEELRTGLRKGLGGTKLDIIGFDCCLMNCVDLCADLVGIADYAVLSQELVSGTGLDYDGWMAPVVKDPSISSEKIAMTMAETYVAENAKGRRAGTATMSVIASEKMPAVMERVHAFCESLTEQIRTNLSGVIRLRTQLTSFGEFMDSDASDLVDLEGMCDAFSALLPQESALLKQSAQQAVCYNCTTSDIASYAHGLSFFLPYETIRNDRQEILSHYSAMSDSYAALAVAMTSQATYSGDQYAITASSYLPSNFYSYDDYYGSGSCSGDLCSIWDGYYGDVCSFDDAYGYCGGNIWDGLNASSGSVWEGYASSSGIWNGLENAPAETPSIGGIWAGLSDEPEESVPAAETALNNIWAGLLNAGTEYYQPGEENPNLQEGISEAVSAGDVLETADAYFASATLTSQMIYSIQLNKNDLDHLASASGILSLQNGDEIIRLGNLGQTTIDWSTGLVFSMFDGSWPMLGGQMIRAEFLYADEEGNTRFVIPARINGVKMYLLGNLDPAGNTQLLGATQGYDENGFAIRGTIPLEEGMAIRPLFTALSADGTEREYAGEEIIYTEKASSLSWSRIPPGSYQYCFGLTDLSGAVHYTDSAALRF